MTASMLHIAVLLVLPPLLVGIIRKTKALVAGRVGPPLWQTYADIVKLLRKGAVISTTTTWVFAAGPIVSLAATLSAGLLVPIGSRAPIQFTGDVVAFAALLALGRWFTMAAALDTGSSFEGMGASREAMISAFAEPALLLGLTTLCVPAHALSFGAAFQTWSSATSSVAEPALLASAITFFIYLLADGSRIPFDDPATHLELTMVHEVMILDHGGPDLAFATYAHALKLFVVGNVVVHALLPVQVDNLGLSTGLLIACQVALAASVGLVESVTARLRLSKVPEVLVGATVITALGLITLFYRGRP
ncbi:MAG: NADH-quinone oxidoreductase subunit H [Polyangiaceae bacterium]|jgi:formate hydrogenlyase subunit 4